MKNNLRIFLFCSLTMVSSMLLAQHQVISLDGEWLFSLDKESIGETQWKTGVKEGRSITIPHTWNVESETERYWGVGWYEKKFEPSTSWRNQAVRLHFDAVYRDATVYINGAKVGENFGSGYTPFSFDISKYLKYGEQNVLVVSASNKFSKYAFPYDSHSDWNHDGGIIRPVNLIITGKPSVRYAHIRPVVHFEDSTATASVKIKTWEDNIKQAKFNLTFTERASQKIVLQKAIDLKSQNGIFTTNVAFKEILPWHFDTPNLYDLKVEVVHKNKTTDVYNTYFGFRKYEIKGNQFYLNEEPVRLPGVEYMAGSYPQYGMGEPTKILEQAVEAMKELNAVITRFHWQQDKRIIEMMDEKGILVQQEIPWWQAPGDLSPELEDLAKKHIDYMIERDFNKPSIFSWGVSNEVFYNTDKDIFRRLIAHANSWQTSNLVAVVSNEIFDRLENDESLLGDIPTWNDYTGTWHGVAKEEMPDKLALINERALRGRPLLITEHGLCEPRFTGGDSRRIVEMTYHYDQWARNSYVMGAIYFSLNDYRTHRGESGKGIFQQRVHGLTDLWFNKKPSFEVYKGLSSPVYFESIQQNSEGKELDLTIGVKNDLPSYTLYGYKLLWQTKDKSFKEISLPTLKPGEKFSVTITDIDPTNKPVIKVQRPTGYVVAEYY